MIPRQWLRLHLSTAIVLMFVASGLLWMNVRELPFALVDMRVLSRGWPFAYESFRLILDSEEAALSSGSGNDWNMGWLIADVLIALIIVVAVAWLCEKCFAPPLQGLSGSISSAEADMTTARRGFQIHLSTTIAVTILTAVLMGINFGALLTTLAWIAVARDGLPLLIVIGAAELLVIGIVGAVFECLVRRREARKP